MVRASLIAAARASGVVSSARSMIGTAPADMLPLLYLESESGSWSSSSKFGSKRAVQAAGVTSGTENQAATGTNGRRKIVEDCGYR